MSTFSLMIIPTTTKPMGFLPDSEILFYSLFLATENFDENIMP